MKLSKKLKNKLKKKLILSMSSIAMIVMLLVVGKLAGFSAPFDTLRQIGEGIIGKAGAMIFDPNYSDVKKIIVDGEEVELKNSVYNYDIDLKYNTPDLVSVEVEKSAVQNVKGEGDYIIGDSGQVEIKCISANKANTTTYTLNLTRPHSNYLKSLELVGFSVSTDFNPETTYYVLNKPTTVTDIPIYATAWDKEATVTISGNTGMGVTGDISIRVSEPNVSPDAVYVIHYQEASTNHNYSYSGEYEEFIVPYTGLYQMQCWGGRGGGSRKNGSYTAIYGKGGYASGKIRLYRGEKYYVYVGGQGTDAVVREDSPGGWNGGGLGTEDNADDETSGGGGGATDIRLKSGEWDDLNSLSSRIMVAGGGRRSFLFI